MTAVSPDTVTTLDEIIDNFSLLEEWDDRYRYVIELGRGLRRLSERDRTDSQQGAGLRQPGLACDHRAPQRRRTDRRSPSRGDSDAHIVRGLIAILFAMFSGKPASEILSADAIALFERLGLREHLTPQRSNGFRSMVERIRADARAALARLARAIGRVHVVHASVAERSIRAYGTDAATCAGAAAGRAPSAWRDASARPHSWAPPSG